MLTRINIVRALMIGVMASVVSAHAAEVSMAIEGSWMTADSGRNLLITAKTRLDSTDADTSTGIGSYAITDLRFDFTQLGVLTAPFKLQADPAHSSMHIYPHRPGEAAGEVRFFGGMDRSVLMPNGLEVIDFDLRLYFSEVLNDTPGSLLHLGALRSASLWLSDQVGARSAEFAWARASTTSSQVPEPGVALLAVPWLILAMLLRGRRRARCLACPA